MYFFNFIFKLAGVLQYSIVTKPNNFFICSPP